MYHPKDPWSCVEKFSQSQDILGIKTVVPLLKCTRPSAWLLMINIDGVTLCVQRQEWELSSGMKEVRLLLRKVKGMNMFLIRSLRKC
jgi:hypothetical protein